MYAELIKQQLVEQEARKTSFEQRGITVITSSGVLVSLLFGIGAVVTASNQYSPSTSTRTLLAWAAAGFAAAAVLGIVANLPLGYKAMNQSDLSGLLQAAAWDQPVEQALRQVTEARLDMLGRARCLNGLKGWFLFGAVILEAVAIGLVAWAVALILAGL
jgi:hypothetical protein